ncbi:MAG: porphobilinogen synthase [Alphaproteobacteria bacterium]|nr:porphobilinogen synthase [Alphaproteobacteria bacterium]
MLTGFYPSLRLRRLRQNDTLRAMVQETRLTVHDLILPLFVEENLNQRTPIASLPGVFRETETSVIKTIGKAQALGVNAFIFFGVSHKKDSQGTDSFTSGGILDRVFRRVREACPTALLIADACFCEYTDHGHCGPLSKHGDVDNDGTLMNLGKQAVTAARAGADIIAPSGMMDGMVQAIRAALDAAGFENTPILSYASKFASCFYGPFRDAAGCSLGAYEHARKDRKTYQMNPANAHEALREAALDVAEGADMLMVKPGLPYLDIISAVKREFKMPTFAYQVSGEFAMLKAAAAQGMLDYNSALMESLLCLKRAGADAILTYGATDAAQILRNG